SGRLRARRDDGKWSGSAVDLSVDDKGNVSGNLSLVLNIPNAFVKKVEVSIGPDGLKASVPVTAGDFQSKDFSVDGTPAMLLELITNGTGLDVKLNGSARVKLDDGFVDAGGELTANLERAGTV